MAWTLGPRDLSDAGLRQHDLDLVARLTIDEQRQLEDAMATAQIFQPGLDLVVGPLVLEVVLEVGRQILRCRLRLATHVIVDAALEQHPPRDRTCHKDQQQQYRQKSNQLAANAQAGQHTETILQLQPTRCRYDKPGDA